jgi:hypothetical protein
LGTCQLRGGAGLPPSEDATTTGRPRAAFGTGGYLSYVDVFWVLMLLSLAAVPLAMSLRKVKLGGGPAPAAH